MARSGLQRGLRHLARTECVLDHEEFAHVFEGEQPDQLSVMHDRYDMLGIGLELLDSDSQKGLDF